MILFPPPGLPRRSDLQARLRTESALLRQLLEGPSDPLAIVGDEEDAVRDRIRLATQRDGSYLIWFDGLRVAELRSLHPRPRGLRRDRGPWVMLLRLPGRAEETIPISELVPPREYLGVFAVDEVARRILAASGSNGESE